MLRNRPSSLQLYARNILVVTTRSLASLKKEKFKLREPLEKLPKQNEVTEETPINAHYLTRTFGSNYRSWATALEKHPELKSLKARDFINSVEALKSLNFDINEIVTKPMVIYNNTLTLMNRYSVLRECGFESISIAMLAKYVTVMNKPIAYLKSHNYIPYSTDLPNRLKNCFTDIELAVPCGTYEELELKALRQIILNIYLRARLDMNDSDINKMWKVYSRVRHRSFKSVQAMVDLLLNDLQFSPERIKKNIYLLHGDAENVKRIINDIPLIDGQNIREILYRRPKIMMSGIDSLTKTMEHVKTFGINEGAILRCLEVLTLGPDTVLERLRDLNEIEEFQVLDTNPRVLRLVHYQNKARLRLDYLNQLKVRCASLHILSCGSEAFAKFARDGSDRTKGRDIVVYLSNVMHKDKIMLRWLLTRHPNWCHIPVTHVKQCFDYLISKKFEIEDIFKNIHLLLYPIKRIEDKMIMLQSTEFIEDLQLHVKNMYEMSNNEILTLILYLIESEFHFTGDGIWTEQHTHHVENFNNLLPDFPESLNKVYKYGVKPAEKLDRISI